ncbi:MAG: hypothetical protein KC776_17090 [Myxococcales bacterium]|nr:hypothetical protein [Myxococcales bacterium]MCB9577146.1 hypothetical protein [Polyangiaceae bacterium]
MKRSLWLIVLFALPAAAAEPEAVDARLACRQEASPGRVLCELEVEARQGQLTWADAVVTSAPDMATPLRARVGPSQATARTPTRIRLPLSLAASREGRAKLSVRARWVLCPGGKRSCVPGHRTVTAEVVVGAIQEPR